MRRIYDRIFKRTFDFLISLIALLILSPLLLVLSLLVRLKLGSPVIFRQERPGKNGKVFTLCKFRTMTDERDSNGELLPDEIRLTSIGQLLRCLSLDELPELYNILKGDMSFVGPRPLLKQYLPLYTPHQARRHEVRPGLTGLAQVNGRNLLSWEQKFEYDIAYIETESLFTDISIIFKTVINVLRREGISSDTSATTELFTGSAGKTEAILK